MNLIHPFIAASSVLFVLAIVAGTTAARYQPNHLLDVRRLHQPVADVKVARRRGAEVCSGENRDGNGSELLVSRLKGTEQPSVALTHSRIDEDHAGPKPAPKDVESFSTTAGIHDAKAEEPQRRLERSSGHEMIVEKKDAVAVTGLAIAVDEERSVNRIAERTIDGRQRAPRSR